MMKFHSERGIAMNPPKENPPPESVDPFADLSKLRLSQAFTESVGTKKLLTTVPVRKPGKQEFVRVHPEAEYRGAFAILELKEDREYYLLMPNIAADMPAEFRSMMLYTTINRQRTVTLWPVRLPEPDGRTLEWFRSAHEGAERATRTWIRIVPNMNLGAYELHEATGKIPEPEWSEHTFQDLLRIAFRERIIDSFDHAVLKRLRGEC
jgi:hypothetical protein